MTLTDAKQTTLAKHAFNSRIRTNNMKKQYTKLKWKNSVENQEETMLLQRITPGKFIILTNKNIVAITKNAST